MNLLNIDLKDYMSDIIDACAEVYGIENKELIKRRADKIIYIMYNNLNGIKEYATILEKCKQRGIPVQEQELEQYKRYVQDETARKKQIQTDKRNTLYSNLENILPADVKKSLDNKYSSINEKGEALLGNELGNYLGDKLGLKTCPEYFSQEDEEKLNNPLIEEKRKNEIYYFRTRYFERIGATIDKKLSDFENAKEFYEYLIQQEDIKKLILPTEIADKMTQLRKKAYEESQKEFIYNSKEFSKNDKLFGDNEDIKKSIYENIEEKRMCVAGNKINGNFVPILFFAIREGEFGLLDYAFLHELGHVIESEKTPEANDWRSGFEKQTNNAPNNPYNSKKRKYERFNETIRDMLAIETTGILHKKGIYIFEPKEFVRDAKDHNTSSVCKSLLTEFLGKYRKDIVDALLHGFTEKLYYKIGEENFEELVDIINKVDYLEDYPKLNLTQKLKNNEKDDPIVIEYNKQLERLNQVYANMENYSLVGENINPLKSAIQATEEKTRMGQILGVKEKLRNVINKIKGKKDNIKEGR